MNIERIHRLDFGDAWSPLEIFRCDDGTWGCLLHNYVAADGKAHAAFFDTEQEALDFIRKGGRSDGRALQGRS
jgi:hypothetical protein